MKTPEDQSRGDARPPPADRARLHPSTREVLRELLGPAGPEVSFAEAVTLQLLRTAAARGGGSLDEERGIAMRVASLLDDPERSGAPAELSRDAEAVSSFFQNADLLVAGSPRADAVALLVMRALEIVNRTEGARRPG